MSAKILLIYSESYIIMILADASLMGAGWPPSPFGQGPC